MSSSPGFTSATRISVACNLTYCCCCCLPGDNTHLQALTEFYGTLSADWALECLKELLLTNMQVCRAGTEWSACCWVHAFMVCARAGLV
jgi:hypothetical protein